ncbi:MAG: puromycin-sensitive aminopeptidase [Acidobacteriaceae bacterium]|jgi:aminopeptidase N
MKQIVLLTASILLGVCLCSAQRLPMTTAPENYRLTFTPDLDKATFAGDETIRVHLAQPTSQIVLNAAELTFDTATISAAGATQTAKITINKDKEQAELALGKPIPAGEAIIHIKYSGILNSDMRGFYLGKDDHGRKYAATQFEPVDARRAFPSFDEPNYKATFDISVVATKGLAAISNSKIISETDGPGNGQRTVRFATTPKMSSYLAALIVGNFEYVEGEADGIPIRVYATPGKKELGKFALEASENILKFYDHYFGIKYPYAKLDLIGLPDFSPGAMENTGCITYRESLLLADDQHASVKSKKLVAGVIAHEMAHQWFGDLVTMKWWDDIWLNEGFATWMESKPIETWKPEWNGKLDDVSAITTALNVDSLANTRPILQAAETPDQIFELFDGIAYGKAAAVLQMLEAYLGREGFRAGVNEYLKQHTYGNATAGDFWGTLAKVSRKPVDKIMPTFVKQAGAPMISASAQCSAGSTTVSLAQQRYYYDRQRFEQAAAGDNELWQVPVCLKEAPDGSSKGEQKCELLTEKQGTFTMKGCVPWVLANAGATGYYRSSYSPDALRNMAKSAESALTPEERIILLSDAWASMRVGRDSIGDYLALAEGLQADRNRAVLETLLNQLEYVGRHLANDNNSDREKFQAWLRQLLAPAVRDLGWQAKPGESDEQRSLRAQLLMVLGETGKDPEALEAAKRMTEQVLADPNSVDSELAQPALHLAAMSGSEELYDRVLAKIKTAKTPEQYYLFVNTLGYFSDPKLLQRTLEYAISEDVRSQDSLGLIAKVMTNPAGERLAWEFVRSHWSEVEKKGGPFASADVVAVAGSFCDPGLRDDVTDFFTAHRVNAAERTFKQTVERINYCVDLKSRQSPQLASWLQQHTPSAAK